MQPQSAFPGPISADPFYYPPAPRVLPPGSPSPSPDSPSTTPASSVPFPPGSVPIDAMLIALNIERDAPFLKGEHEKANPITGQTPSHETLVAEFLSVLTGKISLFNCPDLTCAAESTLWAGLTNFPQSTHDPWRHPSFGIPPETKSDLCYSFKGVPLVHCEVQSSSHLRRCLEQLIANVAMSSFAICSLFDGDPPAPLEIPAFFVLRRSRAYAIVWFELSLQREPGDESFPPLVRLSLNYVRVAGPYPFAADEPWDAIRRAVVALIDRCVVDPAQVRRRVVPTWVVAPYLKDRPDQQVHELDAALSRFRNVYWTDTAYFKIVDHDLHARLWQVPRYTETHVTQCQVYLYGNKSFVLLRMPCLGVPLSDALRGPPGPPPPWDDIARLLVERVADLLKHDITHGDLRPANVLVTLEPELRVDLIDYERCGNASSTYYQTYRVDAFNPAAVAGMTQAGAAIQQLISVLRVIPGAGAAAIVARLDQKDTRCFGTRAAWAHVSSAIGQTPAWHG
ncbi:hypothetical protein PAPYR_6801 [Paratrimastix pyriformis]|uniref:Non-specific serine/threonine protein kinase n=1 Tax=Paratrimastix pyriformis TaxID=342808 RepID=A0ABQ8UEE2_9EUKA|nr:hypothetical protein PAPYR_6801 [Paratrimastix pyriformis]